MAFGEDIEYCEVCGAILESSGCPVCEEPVDDEDDEGEEGDDEKVVDNDE